MLEARITDALIRKRGLDAKDAIQELVQVPVSEILLFGSRALGRERPTSDVDAVAFLELDKLTPELSFGWRRPTPIADLDLDLVPARLLNRASKDRLYWRQGIALYDPQGRLQRYLKRLQKLAQKPLSPLGQAEIEGSKIWFERMSARISENLAAGNRALVCYQLSWVQVEIMQIYCPLQRMHSLGARDLHAHLEASEPDIWEQILKLSGASELEERGRVLQALVRLIMKEPIA